MSEGASADALLPPETIAALLGVVRKLPPQRSWKALRASVQAVEGLALSDRVRLVRDALLSDSPADFSKTIRAALKNPAFTGWMIWPVSEAVAIRAIEDKSFDQGLALLAALTPRLTGEFALRTFLNADLDRTLRIVQKWTANKNEHVRRLATEGTRPRLPWARQVPALFGQPDATVGILDALYRDPSEYVRRSVANHLNDISRNDPSLTITTARRWLDDPDEHTASVVRHALRTLIKAGNPDALTLLGFDHSVKVAVSMPVAPSTTVAVGERLEFTYLIENLTSKPARLAIDYLVHYRKANGSTTAKVFKLTTRDLDAGEQLTLTRRHSFAPVTTRTLYPGPHALELQVNGKPYARFPFDLLASDLSPRRPALKDR